MKKQSPAPLHKAVNGLSMSLDNLFQSIQNEPRLSQADRKRLIEFVRRTRSGLAIARTISRNLKEHERQEHKQQQRAAALQTAELLETLGGRK